MPVTIWQLRYVQLYRFQRPQLDRVDHFAFTDPFSICVFPNGYPCATDRTPARHAGAARLHDGDAGEPQPALAALCGFQQHLDCGLPLGLVM
jgi:hypothetical protein